MNLLNRFIEEEHDKNLSTVAAVPNPNTVTEKAPSRFEKFRDHKLKSETELQRYLKFNFVVEEDDSKN